MREIALDTETTGLDPSTGHRVVEIGAVEMIGRLRTGRVFHAYLNPERDMPPEAQNIHGLSEEFLRDKPLFAEVAEDFLLFVGDSPLVIHNAAFDMKFINWELNNLGVDPLPMSRAIDTVPMARAKFPGAPASLDALCKRFAIDLSARTKHGALLDSELLADVYLELTGGRQAAMELAAQETNTGDSLAEGGIGAAGLAQRESFYLAPSAEELQAHASFLAQIKSPIWANLTPPSLTAMGAKE